MDGLTYKVFDYPRELNFSKRFVIKLTQDKQKGTAPIRKNKSFLLMASFWENWGPLVVTISLYAGIKNYVAEARYIPSGSMLPTLQVNDRLIIEKISYLRRSPKRGDVVVFRSPYSFSKYLIAQRRGKPLPSAVECAIAGFPLINLFSRIDEACPDYIKRVVGIGGDKVVVNSKGELFVNDHFINESYVRNLCSKSVSNFSSCAFINTKVPQNHVFVLGDNRSSSLDGRYWGFLPENQIIGRAFWRFWPLDRTGDIAIDKRPLARRGFLFFKGIFVCLGGVLVVAYLKAFLQSKE